VVKESKFNIIIMDRLAINRILKLSDLRSEYEFEKVSSLYLQLRKESEISGIDYQNERNHIKKLIKEYEHKKWLKEEEISEVQIKESDIAENLVRIENEFNQKRKEFIRKKLKEYRLNQNDLAKILGHRKGYMSELINGLRPFSKEDIIILNQLLSIKLEDLMPPFIKHSKAIKVQRALSDISKDKVNLKEVRLLQIA